MRKLDAGELLRELEPAVAANLDRHLAVAQEWMPHELVPWDRGRAFAGDRAVPWSPEQSTLAPAVRAAFELNLLTEDNLPSYHHAIAAVFGLDGAWGTWVRRWTAEEGRHAAAIRDYLLVTRAVDPDALEASRMAAVQTGWSAGDRDLLRSLAYTSVQELVTRVAHRNTGLASGDSAAEALLAKVAADENLHMVFYRDLVATALELAPEQTVVAIAAEVTRFEMPGAGLAGYTRRMVAMSDAGIYDVRIHRDDVLAPLLRHWNVFDRRFTTSEGGRAQAALAAHLGRLEEIALRRKERRALWSSGP